MPLDLIQQLKSQWFMPVHFVAMCFIVNAEVT
jgi:hypothetical protein